MVPGLSTEKHFKEKQNGPTEPAKRNKSENKSGYFWPWLCVPFEDLLLVGYNLLDFQNVKLPEEKHPGSRIGISQTGPESML